MILITDIRISGFRSLEDVRLGSLKHCHALVGKNSSGKSNVLRALNLFFNDQVDNGRPLDFAKDFHLRPKAKKKRRISVRVSFALPAEFTFRKQQKNFLSGLGRTFEIERTWEMDQRRRVSTAHRITRAGKPVPNADELAPLFLQLITFRYVPNRSVPADILRSESETLAASLVRRMKDQTPGHRLVEELSAAAGKLLEGATRELEASGAPLENPQVAQSALSQMLSVAGFQARAPHGGMVQDEGWGAGHQAFFLYQVLRALDTDYGRYFGWRQATVWAVEEPESALHRELESRLALLMRTWSLDPANRLQILLTTHSPVFAMASDGGSWIALGDKATEARTLSVPELVRAAETEQVSGWTQPLLSHPFNPVILVEGHIDAEVLNHVASMCGKSELRFLSLPALDADEEGGGKDGIIAYLKRHADLVRQRLPEAPLVVLFDWDVSGNEMTLARKHYGEGAADRVVQMRHIHSDPSLGADWRGIERFYPPRVVHEASAADEIAIGVSKSRPISVSAAELRRGKPALLKRVTSVSNVGELRALASVLADVATAVASSTRPQRDLFDSLGIGSPAP